MTIPIEPQDYLNAHQRARERGFRVVSVIVGSPSRARAIFHRWARELHGVPDVVTAPAADHAATIRALAYGPPNSALEIVPPKSQFIQGLGTALKISEERPERPIALITQVVPVEEAVVDKSIDVALQHSLVGGLIPLIPGVAERVERLSGKPDAPAGYRSVHEYVLHALIQHDRSIDFCFAANRPVPAASRKLYEVDLWSEKLRLAIEVDGVQHFATKQKRLDEARDVDLASVGIRTQRILASALMSDPSKALMLVRQTVDSRLREVSR
jgi:very-short-patch-repair endonuclease